MARSAPDHPSPAASQRSAFGLLGYRHLPRLRAAIQKELGVTHPHSNTHSVA